MGAPDGMLFNPVHAGDAASALRSLLSSDFEGVVNVAGNDLINLRSFVGLIGEAVGLSPKFETEGKAESFVADISRLTAITSLGFNPLSRAVRESIVATPLS
jgi:nucleoside-diphosphate-sugar epimerase